MIGEFPKHSSILPSENYKMGVGESMSVPGSGPSAKQSLQSTKDNAKQSAKQSAKQTLQSWLQLMASPGSGALQQLARDTEEVEEEGDQCGDHQVRLSGPSPC